MDEFIYIEFLIEDKSGHILVEQIMQKYIVNKKNIEYKIHSFKGIGKIPPDINKTSKIKTKRLLTDLPMYLKGMSRTLERTPGKKAIFVILDSDDDNCAVLKKNLVKIYEELELSIQVFFCIAIEETEAWLLGDSKALLYAYPKLKKSLLDRYVPDSIIGTWEYLADIIYKGGLRSLKKNASSYHEIGIFKCECAEKIGHYLDIKGNTSPSFNYFIKKLDNFCNSGQ